MSWLGHEMKYPTLHEPFNTNLEDVLSSDRVIVKEFPHHITNAGHNLKEVISSFDKVIIHKRLSILNTSISSSYANDNSKLHKTYQITKEWIDDNQNDIDSNIKNFQITYDILDGIKSDVLRTTYEGVFQTREDINRISEFLGLNELRWLDILDYKRKLRNGDVGMDNLIGVPTPIPKKLI